MTQEEVTEYSKNTIQAILTVYEAGKATSTLTRVQQRNLETLDDIIDANLKEHDFTGTLKGLQGNSVPNGKGGYFDHATEMKQSYTALNKVKRGLEGSLQNPNLSNIDKQILQEGLNKTNSYIQRIQEIFKPYGGIE